VSDYTPYHDGKVPKRRNYLGKYARMRAVREYFAKQPADYAATTAELAVALNLEPHILRGTLRRMEGLGWIIGSARPVRVWRPLPALAVEKVPFTEGTVRQLLERGAITIGNAVTATGCSKQAIQRVLANMVRDGYVRRDVVPFQGQPARLVFRLVKPFLPYTRLPRMNTPRASTVRPFVVEQRDLPPLEPVRAYVNPIRARALGLPVAGQMRRAA